MKELPNQHLLAVDIGNHQMKLGLMAPANRAGWPEPSSIFKVASTATPLAGLAEQLPEQPVAWCVATVHRGAERRLAAWVAEQRPADSYRRLENHELPLVICVEQPDRVGTDRLLAAVAVNALRQARRGAIIIDAGTAITVDLVSADGAFQGGVILPGFGMMARALARDTDLLPLVADLPDDQPPAVIGKATVAAIRSGLFWGSVGAVGELTRRIAGEASYDVEVFVAGGDAARLAPYLPAAARVVPELVLAGIALAWRALPH